MAEDITFNWNVSSITAAGSNIVIERADGALFVAVTPAATLLDFARDRPDDVLETQGGLAGILERSARAAYEDFIASGEGGTVFEVEARHMP